MADDKIRELAEKLCFTWWDSQSIESTLRAELAPLLDAAHFANNLMASLTGKESEILAAELKGWRKE